MLKSNPSNWILQYFSANSTNKTDANTDRLVAFLIFWKLWTKLWKVKENTTQPIQFNIMEQWNVSRTMRWIIGSQEHPSIDYPSIYCIYLHNVFSINLPPRFSCTTAGGGRVWCGLVAVRKFLDFSQDSLLSDEEIHFKLYVYSVLQNYSHLLPGCWCQMMKF